MKLQEGVHGLGIRRPGVGNGLPVREHLILARIKGELYPCAGAPTRTRGECRLPDTSGKKSPSPCLFTFPHLLHAFTFLDLLCLG